MSDGSKQTIADARRRTNEAQVQKVETILSHLLRFGVLASMAIVLLGLLVMYLRHPEYLTNAATAEEVARQMVFPHTVTEVL